MSKLTVNLDSMKKLRSNSEVACMGFQANNIIYVFTRSRAYFGSSIFHTRLSLLTPFSLLKVSSHLMQ